MKKRNHYGPILFEFNLEILNSQHAPPIWVTKKNPTKWTSGESPSNRWFQSITELQTGFKKHNADHMLVLRHVGGVLPFNNCGKRIVVDDIPRGLATSRGEVEDVSYLRGVIVGSSTSIIDVPKRETRVCPQECKCREEYEALRPNVDERKRLFLS